jgi:hypothetical protein
MRQPDLLIHTLFPIGSNDAVRNLNIEIVFVGCFLASYSAMHPSSCHGHRYHAVVCPGVCGASAHAAV